MSQKRVKQNSIINNKKYRNFSLLISTNKINLILIIKINNNLIIILISHLNPKPSISLSSNIRGTNLCQCKWELINNNLILEDL